MQTPKIPVTNLHATGASPTAPGKPSAPPPLGGGASFQALLERLEKQADGLAGREVNQPSELSGAVDEARVSLHEALDLGRDLLEAYREVRLGKAG